MSEQTLDFTIRNADASDLDAVMDVEAEWPEEQRATVDKFVSRLERFPEGFLVVEVKGRIVAVSTSTLTNYTPSCLDHFRSWEACTNGGYLYPIENRDDYNAFYIVSQGIRKAYRRHGIREGMILANLNLAAKMGRPYTVTGAMMPGYDSYCRKHSQIPACDYAFLKQDGKLIDPTLRKLASLGLTLPDARHVIKDFYISPESRNYGALLVNQTSAKP